jgi:hypothetical protein
VWHDGRIANQSDCNPILSPVEPLARTGYFGASDSFGSIDYASDFMNSDKIGDSVGQTARRLQIRNESQTGGLHENAEIDSGREC